MCCAVVLEMIVVVDFCALFASKTSIRGTQLVFDYAVLWSRCQVSVTEVKPGKLSSLMKKGALNLEESEHACVTVSSQRTRNDVSLSKVMLHDRRGLLHQLIILCFITNLTCIRSDEVGKVNICHVLMSKIRKLEENK